MSWSMKVIIEQHDSFTSPNNNLTSNDRDILKRCMYVIGQGTANLPMFILHVCDDEYAYTGTGIEN